jgi:hypothetical protein
MGTGTGLILKQYTIVDYIKNKLLKPTGGSGEEFGWSVAWSFDGSILAIGAPYHDNDPNNNNDNTGAVYIYNNGGMTLLKPYDRTGAPVNDTRFGYSVAWSPDGSILAIGAPHHDNDPNNNNDDTGAVYIYNNKDGGMTLLKPNDNDGAPVRNTWFGRSVAWSPDGSILAIGAPLHDTDPDNNNDNTGAVYIYNNKDGGMTLLKPNDSDGAPVINIWFGWSVAWSFDGSILAIGAPLHDNDPNNNNDNTGAVYIYNNKDGGMTLLKPYDRTGAPVNDTRFGWSVAWSPDGSILAIGAPLHDTDPIKDDDTGAVYIYNNKDGGMTLLKPNDNDGAPVRNTWFGYSVAWSPDGSILAIGAPHHDTDPIKDDDTGAVYTYNNKDGGMTLLKPNDNDGAPVRNTRFGYSVAWSPDGSILAIGAPYHDNVPINDDDTGAVYTYNVIYEEI